MPLLIKFLVISQAVESVEMHMMDVLLYSVLETSRWGRGGSHLALAAFQKGFQGDKWKAQHKIHPELVLIQELQGLVAGFAFNTWKAVLCFSWW